MLHIPFECHLAIMVRYAKARPGYYGLWVAPHRQQWLIALVSYTPGDRRALRPPTLRSYFRQEYTQDDPREYLAWLGFSPGPHAHLWFFSHGGSHGPREHRV